MNVLKWSKNDVANTDTRCYRIDVVGRFCQVVYSTKSDGTVMQSGFLNSVQDAKQWAQNNHDKYGGDNGL